MMNKPAQEQPNTPASKDNTSYNQQASFHKTAATNANRELFQHVQFRSKSLGDAL
jgi:hypothetical protein